MIFQQPPQIILPHLNWSLMRLKEVLEKADERAALKENVKKNLEIEEASKSNIGDMIKAELEEKEDE